MLVKGVPVVRFTKEANPNGSVGIQWGISKSESYCDANFVVTGGTRGNYDTNLRCHQRRQSWHHVSCTFAISMSRVDFIPHPFYSRHQLISTWTQWPPFRELKWHQWTGVSNHWPLDCLSMRPLCGKALITTAEFPAQMSSVKFFSMSWRFQSLNNEWLTYPIHILSILIYCRRFVHRRRWLQ